MFFFLGSGIIWLDNVNCVGFEFLLIYCFYVGWGEGNCDLDYFEDVGVVCDNIIVRDLSNNFCWEVNDGFCEDN